MSFLDPKNRVLILVGLVIISLGFHSYNLDFASYDLDEAVHIWHAQRSYAEVVEQSSHDPNPPVYNLIISAWEKVFGVSETATRFFSVLMGALGVALMFVIASRNFGMAVGITAALLYCFSPIQFRFTHLARPYSMLMVTVLLSYGMLLECIKSPSKIRLLLYYLATTAMIYVHPTSVFNLPAQGLIILLYKFKDIRSIVNLSIPMVAALLSFGIWMMAIPYFERNDSMWFGPPNWDDVSYVIRVFYGHGGLLLIQLAILVLLIVQSVREKTPIKAWKIWPVLIWVVIPFIASIVFSHLFKPVFQDKYVLSAQPAMMLLLAVSIHALHSGIARMVGIVVVFGSVLSSMDTKPQPEGDWRNAVEYVKPLHDENSMIFIDPWYEFRTFTFYFDRHAYEVPDSTMKIIASKRIFTGWDNVYDTIAGRAKTNIVHVIRAHQGAVEPAVDMTRLESVATLISEKDFIGINIRSYQFLPDLDTLESVSIDFSDMVDEVEHMNPSKEYSKTVVYSFDKANVEHAMRISASILVSTSADLEDVSFVVSVEKQDGQAVIYRSVYPNQMPEEDGWYVVNDQFRMKEIQQDWVLKVYVWNPKGKEFDLDDLHVLVEN